MMGDKTSSVNNIYQLDGRVPVGKAIPFGLQHVLAMFVSNLTPITIVAASAGLAQEEIAILLQNAMFFHPRHQMHGSPVSHPEISSFYSRLPADPSRNNIYDIRDGPKEDFFRLPHRSYRMH